MWNMIRIFGHTIQKQSGEIVNAVYLKNDELNIPICVSIVFSEHIRTQFLLPGTRRRSANNLAVEFSFRSLSLLEVAILLLKKRRAEFGDEKDSVATAASYEHHSTSCMLMTLHYLLQLYWSVRRCRE